MTDSKAIWTLHRKKAYLAHLAKWRMLYAPLLIMLWTALFFANFMENHSRGLDWPSLVVTSVFSIWLLFVMVRPDLAIKLFWSHRVPPSVMPHRDTVVNDLRGVVGKPPIGS